jgi:transcriptional regulator with XRE-family HTH domain
MFTDSEHYVKCRVHYQCDDTVSELCDNRLMKFRNTIQAWRKHRGLTQQALADAAGIAKSYVSELERGNRPYNQELLIDLSRPLRCDEEDLIYRNPYSVTTGIPIIGKVFAGPDGNYIDDYAEGAHPLLDPFDLEDRVAAVNEGLSMLPRFRPGETLIFGPRREDPSRYVGEEVMAALDDGRRLIKVLKSGGRPGVWTLESINPAYPPIEAVSLAWARPFEGLKV